MVRQKEAGPTSIGRPSAAQKLRKKNRHNSDRDRPHVSSLVARPTVPKSKHKTILEWTENTDKKRKLEIEFTTNKNPNANFSFVPIGNPELTSMCKELSREQGALVYIVSTTKEKGTDLSDHVHRIGYHFRTHVVEQATTMLDGAQSIDFADLDLRHTNSGNKPDPIPESQEEINKQADAAIRDLFPRIPNTDREMIIRHAFQKGAVFNGKPVVGLQADLTLSRRVQLAVIAHIRHTHTRYDLLLKETSWENARKTVESLCLDILVKWRGDEETGRDQLDEVLREIVVIDDSDDEIGDESDEESASDDEEVDNSDEVANGVAAVDLGITSGPPSPPHEQLSEAQPKGMIPAQTSNSSQLPSGIDPPHQSHAIASRTRSKVKSNHRQKAKRSRRNKRFQAWQDALSRRGEPHSALRTPLNQNGRTNPRDMGESPCLVLNRSPNGLSSSELYTAPYNDDYQTIYAIDNSRDPGTSITYLPSSRRITGPSDFNYRERMLISPQNREAPILEYRQAYDARSSPNKPLPFRTSALQQSYTPFNRDIPSEDMVLPSIEPHIDVVNESTRPANFHGPIRHSQVMYKEVEPERRHLPAHTDATYMSNWGNNQPKRRRLVLADDVTSVPLSSSNTDSYIRLVPVSRSENPSMIMAPSRRAVEVRDGGERHDMPVIIDERPNYPRYIQRAGEIRDQYGSSPIPNTREPTGIDRERHLITDDDSPPHMLMFRRPLEPRQAYSGQQYIPEPQKYENQKAGNQHFSEMPRAPQSVHDPLLDHNRLDARNQSGQTVLYARAPSRYHHEIAQGSPISLSTFPSHPHPSEGNSGLVSYPILSRPNHNYDSRFPSTRDEPILVCAKNSHQFQHERFAADTFERPRPPPREESYRPVDFETASRVEQRYVPLDSRGRAQEPVPYYTSVGPSDIVSEKVWKRPTNITGTNESINVRKLPYRDEVIVLSP